MIQPQPGSIRGTQRNIEGDITQEDPLQTGLAPEDGIHVHGDCQPVRRDEESSGGGPVMDLQLVEDKSARGTEENSPDAHLIKRAAEGFLSPLLDGFTQTVGGGDHKKSRDSHHAEKKEETKEPCSHIAQQIFDPPPDPVFISAILSTLP